MDRWIYIILVAITLMLSGCTTTKTYPESELSSDEVSIIRDKGISILKVLMGGDAIIFRSIDGREIKGLGTNILVKPGRHTLGFVTEDDLCAQCVLLSVC